MGRAFSKRRSGFEGQAEIDRARAEHAKLVALCRDDRGFEADAGRAGVEDQRDATVETLQRPASG